MRDIYTARRKREAVKSAEDSGLLADSHAVRTTLMQRVKAGELTLEEAQRELKRIKRGAKASGQITRNQAWREG